MSNPAIRTGPSQARRSSRSQFLSIAVYAACPISIAWAYRLFVTPRLSVVDSLVLIGVGLILASFLSSFLRAPTQFLEAVAERLRWVFAIGWALLLHVLAIVIGLAGRIIRIILAIILSVFYGVFPIDLLPDLILGLGWIDDGVVFFGTMYWALFAGTKVAKYSLRDNARAVVHAARIQTPFP